MTLDWSSLIIPTTKAETLVAVRVPEWQALRLSLLGMPLEYKYRELTRWLHEPSSIPQTTRRIQVANYVNALKRGGLI